MIKVCSRVIEYSFYGLFLLVPLAFTSKTSELFELNKMWLVWALTIIIGMSWFIKMVLQRKFFIQRTPLDIPIALFLVSQIISTIFSLDPHVSLWGYYSRFNGGLLSIISYILLYYAFLSNFQIQGAGGAGGRAPDNAQRSEHWREGNLRQDPPFGIAMVKRLLFISLISGLIVALWGLPSHFGYDPTCLIFRGHLDVSCWTADFMPKIRIFSTLGQPDWLAAYLAILIPIAIAYAIKEIRNKGQETSKNWLPVTCYLLLVALFYVDLLYTRARSGFLGIWLSLIFFAASYYFIEIRNKKQEIRKNLLFIPCLFLLVTFILGTPINQLNRFTLEGIGSYFQKAQTSKNQPAGVAKKTVMPTPTSIPSQSFESGGGGTESGKIRLFVWEGAIKAWKANPLFGTGVETFAFAYYKYKPAAHNLTSEWNFLYNKAHNEYLNYLATTGIFGLGTYLLMIGSFFFLAIKQILKSKFLISSQIPNSKSQLGQLEIGSIRNLTLALLVSYVSILITNFFGFSVVMTNVYLFMIPAFILVLSNAIEIKKSAQSANSSMQIDASIWQWAPIFFILATSCFLLFTLFRFWQADIVYALGYNLDRAGEYQQAYPNLHKAVELRGDEPVFKDELSINDAIIATALVSQKPKDSGTKEQTISVASSLAQEAINTSNEVVSQHPNNAVFWKTRVRLFYTLSQADSRYLSRALDAIDKASLLAPQDANIWYNLGVLYGQNNNLEKGISALEKTIILKPDYRDAHYALGLFYRTASLDKSGKVVTDENFNKKAIAQMQYILDHISPTDTDARKSLEDWAK